MILKFKSLFIFLLPVLFYCKDNNLDETTRLVAPPAFHYLEFNGVFSVYLVQDTVYSIRIVGSSNTLENISLKTEGDTLRISNESKRKWLNPETNKVKLYIHSNQLKYIIANATCYFETVNPITSDQFSLIMGAKTKLMEARLDLNCNSFLYWNNHLSGGRLTLTGNVNNLSIYTFATESVDASNLIANYALIENNSKGNCEVIVSNRLEYSIRGSGNIYIGGNPKEIIMNEKTSTGQLIPF